MTKFKFGIVAVIAFGFLVAVCSQSLQAQAGVTSGNIVVLRVNDRTLASSTSSGVSLVEYNPSSFASAVQSIAVPTAGSNQFTIVGASTAGGVLSLNPNNTVTFAGYRAPEATASVNTTTSASVNRVIGSLDLSSGAVNTNVGLTGSYSGLSFRSVATADGQNFYLSGANGTGGGPQLATVTGGLPGTVTTVSSTTNLTTSTAQNTRQIQVAGGNVFIASGAANPGQQVHQVGTGTPTTGGQALAASFGNQGTANQYNSFVFARLGTGTAWNGTGFDTIYTVDNDNTAGSTVQKWSFDGAAWTAAGNLSVSGVNNIALRQNSPSSVDLFITTSSAASSTIATLSDTSGFAGTLTGAFSTLLTNTGTEGYYGIVVTPVPEPGTVLAFAAGVMAVGGHVRRRVRRSITV